MQTVLPWSDKQSVVNKIIFISLALTLSFADFAFGQNISLESSHSLAICSDSTLWAWGRNGNGYLGDSTKISKNYAIQVKDSLGKTFFKDVIAVATASGVSVAVKKDGSLWSWGSNSEGQLGLGHTTAQLLPQRVLDTIGSANTYFGDAKSVAGNYESIFVLRNDGSVYACGWNGTGILGDGTYFNSRSRLVRTTKIDGFQGLDSITQISSGSEFAMGLHASGRIWAWGRDYYGETGRGTSGYYFTGKEVRNSNGIGFLENMVAISAGNNFSVGLKNDGSVWTWGQNELGQLGDSTFLNSRLPVQVRDTSGKGFLRGINKIAAGDDHVLALDAAGNVFAWGSNEFGQLGESFYGTNSIIPVHLKHLEKMDDIVAGDEISSATTTKGELLTWGNNWSGTLGNGTLTGLVKNPSPVLNANYKPSLRNVIQIDCGYDRQLALKPNGSVWKWGSSSTNDIRSTDVKNSLVPIQLLDSTGNKFQRDFVQVAAGSTHNLGLAANGVVYGWGSVGNGQLGNPSWSWSTIAFPLTYFGGKYLTNITSIAASEWHSVFLKDDSTVLYIGRFNGGSNYYPKAFQDSSGNNDLKDILAIAAGKDMTLALDKDGMVWAWGTNAIGELGDSTMIKRRLPVRVKDSTGQSYLTGIVAIEVFKDVCLALRSDGMVWAWGRNTAGQNGAGDKVNHLVPRLVLDSTGKAPLKNIKAIAAGNFHCLAMDSNNMAWAWGSNSYGNLGNNTNGHSPLPVRVMDQTGKTELKNIIQISAGELISSFLLSNGYVYSCGKNSKGQTGTRRTLGQDAPTLTQLPCMANYVIAAFEVSDTSSCGAICVDFTDLSQNKPDSWHWEFPGGTPSSSFERNPNICYNSPGVYNVKLVAGNFLGNDSIEKIGRIEISSLPNASAGLDTIVCEGEDIDLIASGGSTYLWAPGTDLSCTNCKEPTLTVNANRRYYLVVTDSNSCQDTSSVQVSMKPLPTPSFTFTMDTFNRIIYLNNSSTNANEFIWSFGDGAVDTAKNASHQYASLGRFQICLNGINDCGQSVTAYCDSVFVIPGSVRDLLNGGDISIVPNPTQDAFSILFKGNQTPKYLDIYNAVGKRVFSSDDDFVNKELNLYLVPGMYNCVIRNKQGHLISKKLIVH